MTGGVLDQSARLRLGDGPLAAVLYADGAVNYALAHNNVSPVRGVTLENRSDQTLSGLAIEVRIDSPLERSLAPTLALELPEVEPGGSLDLDFPAGVWRIDPLAMAAVEEAVTGTLTCRITGPGVNAVAAAPFRILARDEWWALAAEESLAAFVTPRDPAVSTLLSAASDLLQARSGDPSLQGYQAGPTRALAIAEAVYDAMRAVGIRYINPPPSFEGTGQKIRPPREVLADRWGTCLDLAVTYSACIEQTGLNPVLALCKNHAFAGVLRENSRLPELVVRDKSLMANLVDASSLVPVETTATTVGKDTSFADARRATAPWWSADISEVDCLIDVRSAHRQVRPLPLVRRDNAGATIVEVERPAERAVPVPRRPREAPVDERPQAGFAAEEQIPGRVVQWKNSLLDLSARNPLLNFGTNRNGIDLHVPAGILPRVEDLVHDGHTIRLMPNDQIADIHRLAGARAAQDLEPEMLAELLEEEHGLFVSATEQTYARKLRALRRKATVILEESGSNNLYLALGTLLWNDGSRDLRSPLFLLPVTLTGGRRKDLFGVQIQPGGYATPNQCLLEKLKQAHNLVIPAFERPEADESGIDLADSIQAIREALITAGRSFRVDETAHLAVLQFSTLPLWQDLRDHWPKFLGNPVVRHLVETPTESFADPAMDVGDPVLDGSQVDAEALSYCPIAMDGSQLKAIRWAAAGRSFVLEGPPGTGKSQTITNLIANAVAEGRTVLFVAEKQAALDVVKTRLAQVGMGPFCLDVHGRDQSPAAVRAQLRTAMNHRVDVGLDAWDGKRARYRTLVSNLGRYPLGLHAKGPTRQSAWDARQVLLALGPGPCSDVPASAVADDDAAERLYALGRDLGESLVDLRAPVREHHWSLLGPTAFDTIDRPALAESLQALADAYSAVSEQLTPLAKLPRSIGELALLAQWYDTVHEGAAPSGAVAMAAGHPAWRDHATSAEAALARSRADAAPLLRTFRAEVLGADLDGIAARAHAADGRLLKGKARAAVVAELAGWMVAGSVVAPEAVSSTAESLRSLRQSCVELDQWLATLPGVTLPAQWNPLRDDAAELFHRRVLGAWRAFQVRSTWPDAVDLFDAVPTAQPMAVRTTADDMPWQVASGGAQNVPDVDALHQLRNAWEQVVRLLGSNPDDLNAWRGNRALAGAYEAGADRWGADAATGAFLGLHRWSEVAGALRTLRALGLDSEADLVTDGARDPAELEEALRRGVARVVLSERFEWAGLDTFDAASRERLIQRFIETGDEIRGEMVDALPAKILSARSFRPDQLRGLIGELNRELARQRGGLGVRGLLTRYYPVIREVTPCLLMSPSSVARFLPPGTMDIDLLVFDEASQLRVAESIGAMGRAKSVVVVGDSKQMPPTSFGDVLSVDEDEQQGKAPELTVPPDMESVLSECVESNLPKQWLSWHYRSQDESLIAFSNQFYYDGKLASFPRPPEPAPQLGVTWRRVQGTYEHGKARVNRDEATAIVNDIRRRLAANRGSSIGVITFNTQQRDLILDLLEDSADDQVAAALTAERDPLFVKNLENVQGDERDDILFSLAFSRDPTTGRLPLNFGPLNRAGGERRLNVAITRARRQVVLFSSFEPSDIDLGRTGSIGLRHLREYLQLASLGAESAASVRKAAGRDEHLEDVAGALEAAGLVVRKNQGLSSFTVDLAVAETDDGPWTAVLLDGKSWADRATVGDREGLPSAILVGTMGWRRIERVWLPSWLQERDAVVGRIVAAVRSTVSAPRPVDPRVDVPDDRGSESGPSDGVEPSALDRPQVTPDQLSEAESPTPSRAALRPAALPADELSVVPVFEPASTSSLLGTRDYLDRLDDPSVAAAVLSALHEVVRREGPVEHDRLARLVARRFGLERVRAERSTAIVGLLPSVQVVHDELGTFVWPEQLDRQSWRSFRRTPNGAKRPLSEVAPEEILNSMRYLVRETMGISRDELIRGTSEIFGMRRVATLARARLDTVLNRAIAEGELSDQDGVINAVRPF